MIDRERYTFVMDRLYLPTPTKRKLNCGGNKFRIKVCDFDPFSVCLELDGQALLCLARREYLLRDILSKKLVDNAGLVIMAWLSRKNCLYINRDNRLIQLGATIEEHKNKYENLVLVNDFEKLEIYFKYEDRIVSNKLRILSKKRIIRHYNGSSLSSLYGYKIERTVVVDSKHGIKLCYAYKVGESNNYGDIILIEQDGYCIALDAVLRIPYILEGMFGIRHELLYTKLVELMGKKIKEEYKLVPWL